MQGNLREIEPESSDSSDGEENDEGQTQSRTDVKK